MNKGQRVAIVVGLALVAAGFIVGLMPVSADRDRAFSGGTESVDCGSVLMPDDAEVLAVKDCADARSARQLPFVTLVVAGLVVAAGGWLALRDSPTKDEVADAPSA